MPRAARGTPGPGPKTPATLDLYYALAGALETTGKGREALDLYKKILSEDFKFRDVEKRIARLQSASPLPEVERRRASDVPAAAPVAAPAAPPAAVADP